LVTLIGKHGVLITTVDQARRLDSPHILDLVITNKDIVETAQFC